MKWIFLHSVFVGLVFAFHYLVKIIYYKNYSTWAVITYGNIHMLNL